jgi:hypothetical protein
MKAKSKMIRTPTSYPFGMFILGEMFAAASTTVILSAEVCLASLQSARLRNHVHILEMNGDSYRLNQSRGKGNSPADR